MSQFRMHALKWGKTLAYKYLHIVYLHIYIYNYIYIFTLTTVADFSSAVRKPDSDASRHSGDPS